MQCVRVHTEGSETNEKNVGIAGANTLDMFVIHFSTISPGTGIPFNALHPDSVITTRMTRQRKSAMRSKGTKSENELPYKQTSLGQTVREFAE